MTTTHDPKPVRAASGKVVGEVRGQVLARAVLARVYRLIRSLAKRGMGNE